MIHKFYCFLWIYVASIIPHIVFSNLIKLKENYIQDLCFPNNKGYIKIGIVESGLESSGILKTSRKVSTEYVSRKCAIILIPPNNRTAITISVSNINLDSAIKIIISDANTNITLPTNGNFILDDVIFISNILGANVTISFSFMPTSEQSLKMIYTAYYKNTNCLSSSQMECDNGHCIAKVLKCDGYDHCGNKRKCYSIFYYTVSETTRIIIITIIIIIIITMSLCSIPICIFWYCQKRLRHRHQTNDNNVYQSPVMQLPSSSVMSWGESLPRMKYLSAPPSAPYITQDPPGFHSLTTIEPPVSPSYIIKETSSSIASSSTSPPPTSPYGHDVQK